jgi:proteasome lid subunit RPN8/RPN11
MHLSPDTLSAISQHAVAEYPSECCGIVTGKAAIQSVHRCRNMQDDLHAKDPEGHPRTSRDAYAMNREEAERIMSRAAADSERVIAFYHSHIDCGAYFSQMDKEVQTVFGEPEFPEAIHVVIAVYKGHVREIKGYRWAGEKQDFIEVDLT